MFNPDTCAGFTLSQVTVELKGSWCYGACLTAIHLITCLGMIYYQQRGLISLELAITLAGAVLISLMQLLRSEVLRSGPDAVSALRFEQGQWKLRLASGQWLPVKLLDPVFTNTCVTSMRFGDCSRVYPVLVARDETSDDSYRHLQVLLRFGLNQKSAV